MTDRLPEWLPWLLAAQALGVSVLALMERQDAEYWRHVGFTWRAFTDWVRERQR